MKNQHIRLVKGKVKNLKKEAKGLLPEEREKGEREEGKRTDVKHFCFDAKNALPISLQTNAPIFTNLHQKRSNLGSGTQTSQSVITG